MANALLLAEAESPNRGMLVRHLTDDGFEVLGVSAAQDALELAERLRPDLVLLGAAVADEPVSEVCRRLREGEPGRTWDRDVPVIVLGTEQADAVDRVRALTRGADDFVSPPFDYQELLARIHAVLRRRNPPNGERMVAGDIVIDMRTRRVTCDGEAVPLSGKELQLLCKLASDPIRVWEKDELLKEVWGFRSVGRTRTLDSHASRLRRKLSRPGLRPYVLNVWGVGYRLMDD
jgi:DNA-binding response OmpR family regulator